jgi:diguanylate cyclase (GGDEF)-like protein
MAVVSLGLATILWIHYTGGTTSAYTSLIYLSVIIAVVRCGFEITVGLGLFLSIVYLFAVPSWSMPPTFDTEHIIRAIIINLVAVMGAFYVRGMRQECESLLQAVDEKDALLNATQTVNSAEKLDHALNSALLLLRTLIPNFRTAAIYLIDETERFIELAEVVGTGMSELKLSRFSLRSHNLGWDPDTFTPNYIPDTHLQRDVQLAHCDSKARSIACVSLRSLRVPIGMLFVTADEPNAFTERQIALLKAFADRIGYPIQKLRVQEGLQGLAYTDGMTGLYNFRYFHHHLQDEIKRSIRYHRPVSLIILDLDGFKEINDRYGHPAGDRLLLDVANIIRNSIRETDLPARYGGEEFVIICPKTESQEAFTVAQRIRMTVEATRFYITLHERCRITISAGVATFPTDAVDVQALMHAADHALYCAKRSGKNCVVAAESVSSAVVESA